MLFFGGRGKKITNKVWLNTRVHNCFVPFPEIPLFFPHDSLNIDEFFVHCGWAWAWAFYFAGGIARHTRCADNNVPFEIDTNRYMHEHDT